jgi:hypothetical protein
VIASTIAVVVGDLLWLPDQGSGSLISPAADVDGLGCGVWRSRYGYVTSAVTGSPSAGVFARVDVDAAALLDHALHLHR